MEAALRQYFIALGYKKGARLLADHQSWFPIATLLQNQVELDSGCRPTKNPRLVAAIRAVLRNPELTDKDIAAIAKTTEKQIGRMVDVKLLKKMWKLAMA